MRIIFGRENTEWNNKDIAVMKSILMTEPNEAVLSKQIKFVLELPHGSRLEVRSK